MYVFNKKSLEYENVFKSKRFLRILYLSIISLYAFGFIGGSITSHPNIVEKVIYTNREISIRSNEKFSQENLRKLLYTMKVNKEIIPVIIAQSVLETKTYTSSIYLENNNLFGMKESYQRATLAIATNRGHAVYKNWKESVVDYCLYYNTYLRNFDKEKYLLYLQANYAEDPLYISKLIKLIG